MGTLRVGNDVGNDDRSARALEAEAVGGAHAGAVLRAWQAFILDTRPYATHCTALCGHTLHHNPEGVPHPERAARYAATLAAYAAITASCAPLAFWPPSACQGGQQQQGQAGPEGSDLEALITITVRCLHDRTSMRADATAFMHLVSSSCQSRAHARLCTRLTVQHLHGRARYWPCSCVSSLARDERRR